MISFVILVGFCKGKDLIFIDVQRLRKELSDMSIVRASRTPLINRS
jgi:hypothetical protein